MGSKLIESARRRTPDWGNALKECSVLVVGGGIAGLTSAIALGQRGFGVEIVEKDPDWTVYGVGIIQQSNVIRAVVELGIIDDYIDAGFGFNHVEIYLPNGALAAKVSVPNLVEQYPANVGISRPALQRMLVDRAVAEGVEIRLGAVVEVLDDDGSGVSVKLSDGSHGRYDLVLGADGVYSATREMIFPDAPKPELAGQSAWRYNFERPADVTSLCAFEGPIGIGLVPLAVRFTLRGTGWDSTSNRPVRA